MSRNWFNKALAAVLACVLCMGMVPAVATSAAAAGAPVRILVVGNDYSRDTLYYLEDLAKLVGERVESSYLALDDATLRMHARNVAKKAEEYRYYKSMDATASTSSINAVVEGKDWDIIVLQQGVEEAGMNNTYGSDLRFLLDYLADVAPNAKVYWNMTWANQQDTKTRKENFDTLYDGSQAVMYNAIADCVKRFVVGEDAEYGTDFDGWFPVGAAIQTVRATAIGDKLTRDGCHLSLQAGRLTAAMTVLKVLFPDTDLSRVTPEAVAPFLIVNKTDGQVFSNDPAYDNTAANMALLRQSVEAACADLDKAPAMLTIPALKTVENTTPDPDDVTVGQVAAPLNLRFADIVTTKDGTIYAAAYEAVAHVPTRSKDYKQHGKEGYGRLKLWTGSSDGKSWDFDNPILTIGQRELEDWGISPDLYNRYERAKKGASDYAYFVDARDPNLGLMYYDMDGNGTEDEVLLFTFFANDYMESGVAQFLGTFIMHSIDGGKTWSTPQLIASQSLGKKGGGKRGDIAVFSDGQILFPMYSNPRVAGVLLQWNVKTQQWDTVADTEIKNYVPEKTTDFTEPSFIAPDPDGDIVYGFVRDNGQAVISYNRGRTWEHIYTIPGNVQQPGWAYIDETRAFATWSFDAGDCRDTRGQMVYFDAGWEATQFKTVHENYYRTTHDAGDPSSKLLANGQLLTIMYDTSFRAINGKFLDPNAPEFQLPELSGDAAKFPVQEYTPMSANLMVGYNLPETHSLHFTATFSDKGKLTATMVNGAEVELAPGRYGIQAEQETQLQLAVTHGVAYVKAWPVGEKEPEGWAAVKGETGKNVGRAIFTGSGVELGVIRITRNARLAMAEGGDVTAGESAVAGTIVPADMADNITWTTSNPEIATVDGQGEVTFVGSGMVTITASAGNATGTTTYRVKRGPAEISNRGEAKVIFADDFEGYSVGENAFFNQAGAKGYSAGSASDNTRHNVVAQDGNQYLELVAKNNKSAVCIVNTTITGDYTVQFDFLQEDTFGATFFNLWQGDSVYAMVQMLSDHVQIQYEDAELGEKVTSDAYFSHDVGTWNTMKIARVDGGIYIKAWPQGAPEPAGWQYSVRSEDIKTTGRKTKFRFSINYSKDMEHTVLFDNLVITQRRGDGADLMTDVRTSDWYYDAVGYVVERNIMSGYNATKFGPNDTLNRAMVVQVLYNKEGKPALNGLTHNFSDVPADQWFNNAVTWGSNRGVVSGYGGGVFKPEDAVTIEQVAVILWNYSNTPTGSGDLSKVGNHSDWAANALKWAVEKGILNNVPFANATEKATRAQTAQMLTNYLRNN